MDQVNETAEQAADEVEEAVKTVTGKLEGWLDAIIANLPNLVVAVLVLMAFWLLARIARKLTRRLLDRTSTSRTITLLLARLVAIATIVVGFFVALGVLGLDKTVTSLLAGAGVVGLALGLAFQDIAADSMAGLVLSVRQPFNIGDIIETQEHFGTVETITLRTTRLRRPEGQLVMLPNREVTANPLINFSRLGQRRVDVAVGVSYGDDLEKAKRVTIGAVEGIEARDSSKEIELFYTEFGDSSINFTVRFWIDFHRQPDFLSARSEAIMRIKQAFDENDITIPFPIRTVDFGIKGGDHLAEVLEGWPRESGPRGAAPAAGSRDSAAG